MDGEIPEPRELYHEHIKVKIIVDNNPKYLEINPTKNMQDLYKENYKH